MRKGECYDIDALKTKRNHRIRIMVYMLAVLLVISNIRLWEENKGKDQQIRDLTIMVTAERERIPEPARGDVQRMKSLGEFKIYHYCSCVKCCGKNDGITKTGTRAREGRTIAVDPSVIPLGSEVVINGQEYIAEDIGSGIIGKKIDIFVSSHEEALDLGITAAEVFLKK